MLTVAMRPVDCVQAITFRSESEMTVAADKLPVGSLAFVLAPEMLFLRVPRGLREIQVKTGVLSYHTLSKLMIS